MKRKDHQIIKADIARELGVSAAKVDRLCRELLEEGYLRSDGGRALFLRAPGLSKGQEYMERKQTYLFLYDARKRSESAVSGR